MEPGAANGIGKAGVVCDFRVRQLNDSGRQRTSDKTQLANFSAFDERTDPSSAELLSG
jgi:hypothetical protein